MNREVRARVQQAADNVANILFQCSLDLRHHKEFWKWYITCMSEDELAIVSEIRALGDISEHELWPRVSEILNKALKEG